MPITVGAQATAIDAIGQSPAVPVPAGVANGDRLFAALAYSGVETAPAPTGWGEVLTIPYSATGFLQVITRLMVAGLTQVQWTLSAAATGTWAKSEMAMVAVRGGDTYTVGGGVSRATSAATTVAPGVTVPDGGLLIGFFGERSTSQSAVNAPTGMTEWAKVIQSLGGGGSALVARQSPPAGASGTRTATYGVASPNGAGVLVALAAATGNPPAVSAGDAQVTPTGSAKPLAGTASGATGVEWTQSSGPTLVTITNPTSAGTASVTPTVAGVYTFRLTATNPDGASFDEMTLTVTTMTARPSGVLVNPGNYAPVNADTVEGAISDSSDVTWVESAVANATLTVQLQPIAAGVGYKVDVRMRFGTTPVVPVRVELLQGTTVVASRDFTPTTSLATYTMTLTSAEVSAITSRVLAARVTRVD